MLNYEKVIKNNKVLPTPRWALDLIEAIARGAGIDTPPVTWYANDGVNCGGFYDHMEKTVHIISSGDRENDELAIAHEMSHAILNTGHSVEMYVLFILLVHAFRLNREKAIIQELMYQPTLFTSALRKVVEEIR